MRDKIASAQDTIAEQELREQAAAASERAANVPWTPEEAVYRHHVGPVADNDDIDGQDDAATADVSHSSRPAPPRLRRTIPLLWAAVLTVAALQHAGEVERRMTLREPSVGELDMRDRSALEIKAAWRNIGTVTLSTDVKSVAEKTELAIAQPQIEQTATRDTPSGTQEIKSQETERPLVEPITEAVRETMSADVVEKAKKEAAQQPVQDINTADVAAKPTEEQAKAETAQAVPPVAHTSEPVKVKRKGRVTTSRASETRVGRAETARPKRTRVSSTKYVAFDGYSPRYFTIEQPSRIAP